MSNLEYIPIKINKLKDQELIEFIKIGEDIFNSEFYKRFLIEANKRSINTYDLIPKNIIIMKNNVNIAIIELMNEVNELTIKLYLNLLIAIKNKKIENIIIDFNKLTYIKIDSLEYDLLGFIKKLNLNITFIVNDKNIEEMLIVYGIKQFFTITHDINEAVNEILLKNQKLEDYIFPKMIHCPICDHKIKIVKYGKRKCENCKTKLNISYQKGIELV